MTFAYLTVFYVFMGVCMFQALDFPGTPVGGRIFDSIFWPHTLVTAIFTKILE